MSSSTLDRYGDPADPGVPGTCRTLWICLVLAVGAFEALWFGVVTESGLAALDPDVVGWVVAHRGPGLVATARVVSDVGAPAVTVTAAVVVLGWLAWTARWRSCGVGAFGLGLLITVDVTTKWRVARPRPPVGWHAVVAGGWSFPSGHALLSLGTVLLIGRLARRHGLLPAGPRGYALAGVTACCLLLVGASRVVLAVHFPSDVLAGWTLAVVAVTATACVDVGLQRPGVQRCSENGV